MDIYIYICIYMCISGHVGSKIYTTGLMTGAPQHPRSVGTTPPSLDRPESLA